MEGMSVRKRSVENHELILKNTESFSIELFLLSYPLLLISGDVAMPPHYVLIFLALASGVGLPVLFRRISYSFQLGLLLALFLTMPLFLIGVSVAPMSLVIAFVFWRLHMNFSAERHARWNFLAINIVVFTVSYLLTIIYLSQPEKSEFLHLHIRLFMITTVLAIVVRYFILLAIGNRTANFQFKEVNKMFSKILGIGVVGFLFVYYFMEYFFSTMMRLVAFLFGDLFNKTDSMLPEFQIQEQSKQNKSGEIEELTLPTSTDSIDLSLLLTFTAVIIAIVIIVILVKQQKIVGGSIQRRKYRITNMAIQRNDKVQAVEIHELDCLQTANTIRMAYQDFEKEARRSNISRLAGETVKEWFERMNWDSNNDLIHIYDKVRYGSLAVSEAESRQFINKINEIKKSF